MKRISIIPILGFVIYSFLIVNSCKKEKETEHINIPPPCFYEFVAFKSDGAVTFYWNFCGFYNSKYGVEVTYFQNNVKKVQKIFGVNRMKVSGLTNGVTYSFIVVAYDAEGNRSEGFTIKAQPNTPFIIVSPTTPDGYTLEDGKVRIDLRFNRPADINCFDFSVYNITYCLVLKSGSNVVIYSHEWLEGGQVLSIVTNNTKESFCSSFPCSLSLNLNFRWFGGTIYVGLQDTNGMQLDGDYNGSEMGEWKLTFALE